MPKFLAFVFRRWKLIVLILALLFLWQFLEPLRWLVAKAFWLARTILYAVYLTAANQFGDEAGLLIAIGVALIGLCVMWLGVTVPFRAGGKKKKH